MKSRITILMLSILTFVLLMMVAASWYYNQYAMEVVKGSGAYNPSSERNILVATQGSDFKEALTASIITAFNSSADNIEVIDVTSLPEVVEADWDAIVIIHTWEYFVPHKNVAEFMIRVSNHDKLIVVTTSGGGNQKLMEVDGISSASMLNEIDTLTSEITMRINALTTVSH